MTCRPQLKHRLPRGGNACDFCGAPDVYSLYACHNFDWQGVPVFRANAGRWAACWACSDVIEVQRWDQLNRRVMREVSKRQGISPDELESMRVSLKALHKLFAAHVLDGEALKVHLPHVRRFIMAPS